MALKGGSSCKNPRAAGYVATPLDLYKHKVSEVKVQTFIQCITKIACKKFYIF